MSSFLVVILVIHIHCVQVVIAISVMHLHDVMGRVVVAAAGLFVGALNLIPLLSFDWRQLAFVSAVGTTNFLLKIILSSTKLRLLLEFKILQEPGVALTVVGNAIRLNSLWHSLPVVRVWLN